MVFPHLEAVVVRLLSRGLARFSCHAGVRGSLALIPDRKCLAYVSNESGANKELFYCDVDGGLVAAAVVTAPTIVVLNGTGIAC